MEKSLNEALAAYGMEGARATLLRHNENATYHVAYGGRAFVLRIHAPRPGFVLSAFGVDRHGRGKLEAELLILRALAEGGIPVQRPITNRAGEWVTALESGDCATLLTWLEGETVGELTDEIAADAARLAGRIHRFLGARPELARLDRYHYDEMILEKLSDLLSEGDRQKAFGDGMGEMRAALDAIGVCMADLREKEGGYGLIHADLSKGNLIATPFGLAPIDFCLSGYGFHAQDVGGLVADFGEGRRAAILRGYQDATGSAPGKRSVDAFVALGVLLYIGTHWQGVYREDWFPGALSRWRRTLFRPLAEKQTEV